MKIWLFFCKQLSKYTTIYPYGFYQPESYREAHSLHFAHINRKLAVFPCKMPSNKQKSTWIIPSSAHYTPIIVPF